MSVAFLYSAASKPDDTAGYFEWSCYARTSESSSVLFTIRARLLRKTLFCQKADDHAHHIFNDDTGAALGLTVLGDTDHSLGTSDFST